MCTPRNIRRKAAKDGYLPSLSVSADYGLAGTYDALATHGVMDVRGTLNIPIFQGGKVHGDVLEADARLEQSRQRLDNLHAQIDDDVRTALLNIESAEEQVEVARSNIDLADETLAQSQGSFRRRRHRYGRSRAGSRIRGQRERKLHFQFICR